MFGNYYAPYFQVPDTLAQFKAPYQSPQQAPQQQNSGLLWVQGETGAKSFLVAPGQSALLMDSEATRFYLKSTDNSGMPLPLRIFEYQEITRQATAKTELAAMDPGQYVTREEFETRLAQMTAKPAKKVKEETENE